MWKRSTVFTPQYWPRARSAAVHVIGSKSGSYTKYPPVVTSILLTSQPVATVILAALLVDESPSPVQLVGAAAILSGLVLAGIAAPSASALRFADAP